MRGVKSSQRVELPILGWGGGGVSSLPRIFLAWGEIKVGHVSGVRGLSVRLFWTVGNCWLLLLSPRSYEVICIAIGVFSSKEN